MQTAWLKYRDAVIAVRNGDYVPLAMLISTTRIHADLVGTKLLYIFKELKNAKAVQLLTDHGVTDNFNRIDQLSPTMIVHYARNGHILHVELCLWKGIDINTMDNEKHTPLFLAAHNGQYDTVQLLLRYGADVDKPCKCGETALIRAAIWGHTNVVKLLLDYGANIEATDCEGNTALIATCMDTNDDERMVDVTKTLLDRGANINAQNLAGATAFTCAKEIFATNTIKVLAEYITK